MRLTMLLQPVDRLDEAARFYRETLGFREAVRDGERFALFETGALRIALVAGEERLVDRPALAYGVDDVDRKVDDLCAAGARVLRAPENGPHERRAVLADPGGQPFVLTARFRP